MHLVCIYLVHLYCSNYTTAAAKKLRLILSVRSDFLMTDSLSLAVHVFDSRVLTGSRLIRNCFLGRWSSPLASENYHLVWRCHLFDKSTCILSCLSWYRVLCLQLPIPDHAAGFRLGRLCICKKGYVISVVCVCSCFCGVYFVSLLCQHESGIFHYIYRLSKHVV